VNPLPDIADGTDCWNILDRHVYVLVARDNHPFLAANKPLFSSNSLLHLLRVDSHVNHLPVHGGQLDLSWFWAAMTALSRGSYLPLSTQLLMHNFWQRING